ncbi:hypothetical protein FSY45_24665 [Comamonas sp. Z1]|uniref:hypothetical protein n=1 Tax=Comamonas sp. Z1 TaxID=2601246 RepID=UPI0011E818B8|nr:hypothetical protein [Comamonas sp. Z1]TYK70261.1 hypothetical protein FSY45_24665 [Comamonas sp. Z1]
MEFVQIRPTARRFARETPSPAAAPIVPLKSPELWNLERSCYHRLDEKVRNNHKETGQLYQAMREHLIKLKGLYRIQGTPGHTGLVHAIPTAPSTTVLTRWHLDRSNQTALLDGSREWHFMTWKQLIALESEIAKATQAIYTKEF